MSSDAAAPQYLAIADTDANALFLRDAVKLLGRKDAFPVTIAEINRLTPASYYAFAMPAMWGSVSSSSIFEGLRSIGVRKLCLVCFSPEEAAVVQRASPDSLDWFCVTVDEVRWTTQSEWVKAALTRFAKDHGSRILDVRKSQRLTFAPVVDKKRDFLGVGKQTTFQPEIVAVGSSTGGPAALVDFFKAVGGAVGTAPFVVTQHLPDQFTSLLVGQIAKSAGVQVCEAVDGDLLLPGVVHVAPGGSHLLIESSVNGLVARLHDGPKENFCKPAVDPMFRSLKALNVKALLVILTGMGRDGVEGVRACRAAGAYRFRVAAQDEASSVVWGMPGAVVKEGFADYMGNASDLGRYTASLLAGGRHE